MVNTSINFILLILNFLKLNFLVILVALIFLASLSSYVKALSYDKKILNLKRKLKEAESNLNFKSVGRGISTDEFKRQLEIAQRKTKEEIADLEYERGLFLERTHLISLFKIK